MKKEVKDLYMYLLGALIVIGFFTILIVVFKTEIPTSNSSIANIIIGALVAKFGYVVGYFFGSSKSSADQHEAANKAAESLANNTVSKTTEQIDTKIN